MKNSLQRIAIGIVKNNIGQYLIAKRSAGVHLENYWEFPGGKVKQHESFKMALRRELQEEIGIQPHRIQKFFEFQHKYDDRNLHFQAFKIFTFACAVRSCEGQQLEWVENHQLDNIKMPPANRAIVAALQLPNSYMIADYAVIGAKDFFSVVQSNLMAGIKIIQLRAHELRETEYIALAQKVYMLCEKYSAKMICNCELDWLSKFSAHGIHLTSSRLIEVCKNEICDHYFSASCHTPGEVELANQLQVQCILVGPVHNTASHPTVKSIEWGGFSRLCSLANMPVYALGGVAEYEKLLAIAHGAQGIAGIRTFISD